MKRIIFALLITFSTLSLAQGYSVESLLSSTVFVPYMQIPFRVTGNALPTQQGGIRATILDDTDNVCQIMADPFIVTNFFLRCKKKAVIKIKFEINGSSITRITYGPLTIRDMGTQVVVDPISDALAAQISLGQALFSSNCIACHSAGSLRDRTAAQIQTMIQVQPQMKLPVLRALTPAQIEAIATYLRNL